MDKIIKITTSVFLIVLVAFLAMIAYNGYVEEAYRNSLSGTYTYTCTVTTDTPLTNVTLFIPVPADSTGNSPMVSQFSAKTMAGIPGDWNTALFDTGKATLLKVAAASLSPGPSGPLTVTMTSDTTENVSIDTLNPVENSVMYRPVQDLVRTSCPDSSAGRNESASCYTYRTAVYADYLSSPGATVTFTSTLNGKNSWQIFGPGSNEYHSELRLVLNGEHHGWATADGTLTTGLGDYSIPALH